MLLTLDEIYGDIRLAKELGYRTRAHAVNGFGTAKSCVSSLRSYTGLAKCEALRVSLCANWSKPYNGRSSTSSKWDHMAP